MCITGALTFPFPQRALQRFGGEIHQSYEILGFGTISGLGVAECGACVLFSLTMKTTAVSVVDSVRTFQVLLLFLAATGHHFISQKALGKASFFCPCKSRGTRSNHGLVVSSMEFRAWLYNREKASTVCSAPSHNYSNKQRRLDTPFQPCCPGEKDPM